MIQLHPVMAITEKGRREGNEDSIYPMIPTLNESFKGDLFMVCDGVGGAAKGELASSMVCTKVSDYLLNQGGRVEESSIIAAIRNAEKAMVEHVRQFPGANGMATTLVMLSFLENEVLVTHIGDSRMYQIRNGAIVFQTKDHSLMNELLDNNLITPEQAVNHPQRNVVSRAIVGDGKQSTAEFNYLRDIRAGDYFFICSDGILEGLSNADLVQILEPTDWTNQEKIRQIKTYCEERSNDNFSCVLVQVEKVGQPVAAATSFVAGGVEEQSGPLLSKRNYGLMGLLLLLVFAAFGLLLSLGKKKTPIVEEGVPVLDEIDSLPDELSDMEVYYAADTIQSFSKDSIRRAMLDSLLLQRQQDMEAQVMEQKEALKGPSTKETQPVIAVSKETSTATTKTEVSGLAKLPTPSAQTDSLRLDSLKKAFTTLPQTSKKEKLIQPIVNESELLKDTVGNMNVPKDTTDKTNDPK